MPPVNSLRALTGALRGARLDAGLSQAEVASRARVSRQWLSEFETGKPTAELGLVLRLIDALGLELSLHARGADPAAPHDRAIDLDALLDGYRSP